MPAGQTIAPELSADQTRPDVIEPTDYPQDHGAKHGQVSMADNEIIEMRELLKSVQGFDRPLHTANEVIEHPDHEELRRIVVAASAAEDGAPPPQQGAEEIDDDGHDRNDHPHAVDDGDGLRPVRDRAV